jgi:hypothetical protein
MWDGKCRSKDNADDERNGAALMSCEVMTAEKGEG